MNEKSPAAERALRASEARFRSVSRRASWWHTGPFLGMVAGAPFEERPFELAPGDRPFADTDGLVEQWRPDGARVDEHELFAALASGTRGADGMAALEARLAGLRAAGAQTDDVTVLSLASTG